MKLGWRILLPISIVNILVTGLVQRLLAMGGNDTGFVLKLAGELTQLLIALLGVWLIALLAIELLKPARHKRMLFSSAARFADQMGGIRSRRMGA
jgi:hypothetical protein